VIQLRCIEVNAAPPNKQLERTVTRRRVRAASAPFHYAHAARWTARRAAAQLRRSATYER
jgi:predicted N-formylglutamate amidohydrolase